MKSKLILTILIVIAVLGSASGWVYHATTDKNNDVTQEELMNLQVSFMQQYGTEAAINEVINPKIYEIAWTGSDGSKNVSMNVGGVWVLIASIPAPQETPTP